MKYALYANNVFVQAADNVNSLCLTAPQRLRIMITPMLEKIPETCALSVLVNGDIRYTATLKKATKLVRWNENGV